MSAFPQNRNVCINFISLIKVGDNVTIAPNAVVVNDVPDNVVVVGVPAIIKKTKSL